MIDTNQQSVSMVDRTYQRKIFEKFAAERGFDPLNPDNWYPVRRNNVLAVRVSLRFISSRFSSPFSFPSKFVFFVIDFLSSLC
jgi:hypothetical protein